MDNLMYLNVFESFPLPAILLNEENGVKNLNRAAAAKFLRPEGVEKTCSSSPSVSSPYVFNPGADAGNGNGNGCRAMPFTRILPWLADDLAAFLSSGSRHCTFEKSIGPGEKASFLKIDLSRILDASGEFKATLVVIDDQAERKRARTASPRDAAEPARLENQLRHAQKMEALGSLAGGIAHDFNNILAPILGYTEMGMQDLPHGHPVRECLDEILKASLRAKELVKQIQTFSCNTEQDYKPVRVSLIVKEAIKLLRSSLPSTIEIRQSIPEDVLPGTVMCEPTQLHQVVVNLCTNAAHAMREKGGTIRISLAHAELNSESMTSVPSTGKPGSCLRLSVEDTGHGMEDAVRERIFEPYFTTKGPKEGTGMGLAIVYGIVEKCGGTISVSSEPGKGTCVHVHLPRVEQEERPRSRKLPIARGQGECVLLVDDDQELLNMTQQLLNRLGYEVEARGSGMDALEAFRVQPERFDLVITDFTMPHMTGTELSRELLRICPGLPIVLFTGFSEMIDERKARNLGIKGYALKPVDMNEIAQIIRNVLSADTSSSSDGQAVAWNS